MSSQSFGASGSQAFGRSNVMKARTATSALWCALACAMLGGCVANSSNPLIDIAAAESNDAGATLHLDVSNPGGRHLTVKRLSYQISHGEAMFPVANGEWTGELDLPARGHATLTFAAPFDTAPPEVGSRLLHLNGELFFVDRTGFLGLRFMDLTHTAFQDEIEASEKKP